MAHGTTATHACQSPNKKPAYLAGLVCAGLAAGLGLTFGCGGDDHTRFNASLKGIAGSSLSPLLGLFVVDTELSNEPDGEDADMNAAEEEILFHNALGNALSQWAYAEGQLQRIVLQCVPPASRSAVAAAYISIDSFYAKLRFCDNLVVGSYGATNPHLSRWAAVKEKAHRLSAKRNLLAHGSKALYINNTVGRRWALVDQRPVDGQIPDSTGEKPPSSALCLLDLAELKPEFHQLTDELCNVFELLRCGRAPFPEGGAPRDGPMTIPSLRARLRAALGLPPPPSRKSRRAPGDEAAERERQKG